MGHQEYQELPERQDQRVSQARMALGEEQETRETLGLPDLLASRVPEELRENKEKKEQWALRDQEEQRVIVALKDHAAVLEESEERVVKANEA